MLILIACVDQKMGIGKANQLAWKNKEEMMLFKQTTLNQIVVMGSKTFLSINKPLINRVNIVISNKMKSTNDILVTNNINYILDLAKQKDVYIIGGEMIYQLFDKHYDRLIISFLNNDYNCDKFLKIDLNNYQLIKETKYESFINRIYEPKQKY